MIDSHCHLDDKAFVDDLNETIQRALDAGITTMLCIDAPLEFINRHPAFLGSVGVHPHEAQNADESTIPRLKEIARHPRIIAVGEIGLDYHYDFSPRDVQKRVFIEHLEAAQELNLPIIIHTREAWDDTFDILQNHWKGQGIMHCFSGGPAEAERCLELGFYLAFGGVITFPKSIEIQEAAKLVPDDRILIETDAPYLAPVPRRGRRNEPALMVYSAAKLAELRQKTVKEIDQQTTENFRRLFSLN